VLAPGVELAVWCRQAVRQSLAASGVGFVGAGGAVAKRRSKDG
jgi:hypothetical protein